jgi:bacteriocin-like protein
MVHECIAKNKQCLIKENRMTNDELQELIQEALKKSSIDPEFRALLLRDPSAGLSQITSKALPDDFAFKFVDNSGSVKTIALPDPVAEIETEELSEEELEAVSGGANAQNVSVATGWSS